MKVIIFGGSRGVGKAIVQRLESEFEMRASEFITNISRTAGTWPYEPFDTIRNLMFLSIVQGLATSLKTADDGQNVDEMLELQLNRPNIAVAINQSQALHLHRFKLCLFGF